MAGITFSQNTYSGEVLEHLLTCAIVGNDTVDKGLIFVKSGIQHQYVIPSIRLGDIVQDNLPTPTSSKGDYKVGERYLTPENFMIYFEFNPRDFEKFWKPFQPNQNLVFRELDPKVQAKMVELLIARKNEYIGSAIWMSAKGNGTGDATVTPPTGAPKLGLGHYKYFDGIMKEILVTLKAEDAYDKVVLAGATALSTGEEIEAALYTMFKKIPKAIRGRDLKFLMSYDIWDVYDQYLTAKASKYVENSEVNVRRFKGKQIIPINGIAEQTIVCGNFTKEMDSNMWMGVDYSSDTEVLKIDQLQANSELYFFQMRMKMDVNIVNPSEIVVWTNYTNVA